MSGNKFQGKYRMSSARHLWHEYNGGLYFITICTKNRECYFGDIARRDDVHIVSTDDEPTMQFTEIGKYAVENLEQIKNHYPYCEIPVFVVMPNHIHAVVVIDDADPDCRDDVHIVSTETTQNPQRWKNNVVDEKMQSVSQKRGRLSVVMGGFKSAITRYANQKNIQFGWQSRFHDHIIRNQDECNRIADYIENNPHNWESDKNNDDILQSIVHNF